jgi:vacuolar-type H+-ATPase subunit H
MNLLDSIREEEQNALKTKQLASAEAREMAQNAEKEAKALSAQKLADAKCRAEALLAEAKVRIDQKAKDFLANQGSQDSRISASAAGQFDAAVHYIVERIDTL